MISLLQPDLLLPLELLGAGEWAEIAELTGDAGLVCRMEELGLHVGSRLQMLRSGSPCVLMSGNSRISLRGDLAMQILVRPVQL